MHNGVTLDKNRLLSEVGGVVDGTLNLKQILAKVTVKVVDESKVELSSKQYCKVPNYAKKGVPKIQNFPLKSDF